MRVLVAGGAGFIGSHLCKALVRRGHHVTCLDRLYTSDMSNIRDLFGTGLFLFVQADVCSGITFHADWIFHLASPAAPSDIQKYEQEALNSNTQGTSCLMKMAKEMGAKFMFISSMKVLGNCSRVQPYIFGKRWGEEICATNGAKVARLASVYGPGMRLDDSRVIPVFIRKALTGEPLSLWNGGGQVDSFCYVSDMVDGLIRFMESDTVGLMELGYPGGITIYDLAMSILLMSGSKSPMVTDEKVLVVDECHRIPDIAKAKDVLGWEPKTSLQEGLRITIDYVAEKIKENHLHACRGQLGSPDNEINIPSSEALC